MQLTQGLQFAITTDFSGNPYPKVGHWRGIISAGWPMLGGADIWSLPSIFSSSDHKHTAVFLCYPKLCSFS